MLFFFFFNLKAWNDLFSSPGCTGCHQKNALIFFLQ
uniref:Uncharacterized protein n=1 Tax=Rhizophora mucronata TaxID=61149 RepID=A0A2P2IQM7_RHIMU